MEGVGKGFELGEVRVRLVYRAIQVKTKVWNVEQTNFIFNFGGMFFF